MCLDHASYIPAPWWNQTWHLDGMTDEAQQWAKKGTPQTPPRASLCLSQRRPWSEPTTVLSLARDHLQLFDAGRRRPGRRAGAVHGQPGRVPWKPSHARDRLPRAARGAGDRRGQGRSRPATQPSPALRCAGWPPGPPPPPPPRPPPAPPNCPAQLPRPTAPPHCLASRPAPPHPLRPLAPRPAPLSPRSRPRRATWSWATTSWRTRSRPTRLHTSATWSTSACTRRPTSPTRTGPSRCATSGWTGTACARSSRRRGALALCTCRSPTARSTRRPPPPRPWAA